MAHLLPPEEDAEPFFTSFSEEDAALLSAPLSEVTAFCRPV
jgi:hypothetical protein